MKNLRRNVFRTCAVVFLLAVAAAFGCLDFVDYRPYFREQYYSETTARLKESIAAAQVVRGELAAGFGRAKLTPSVSSAQDNPNTGQFRELPLAGYGNRRGKPATGVHDDIYVKAAALKVGGRIGVMIGADALIIPPEVADLAAEQLRTEPGLTREQIYLSATHTHSSLGGWGEGMVAEAFAGGFHTGVREWFASRIVAAVREAIADLKPAQFGAGRFQAPKRVRNRVVGALGETDPEFSYIVLKQIGGRTGILGAYGAHATILSGDQMQFSADYPGYWQRAVEQQTGGEAIFLAGDVGSQSPAPSGSSFGGAEQMGQELAKTMLDRLADTVLTNSIAFGMLGLDIVLPPLGPRLSDGVRLRPWLAKELLPSKDHVFLQVFRLGDSYWVSTPCDFSGELALGIKDSFRVRGENVTITSFNGDYVGYVILPRYYHLDGYEPRTMSFYGPYVPEYFDELIRKMIQGLADK